MTNITLTQKDVEELIKYINLLHESLRNAGEIFDLSLSDLRNLEELQWELFRKLKLKYNDDDKERWRKPFVFGEKK